VTVIINDGASRLMTKDKAYSIIIALVPSLAARLTSFLRDEKSFIVDIGASEIIEMSLDEKMKKTEIVEQIRSEMRVASPSVIDEATRQRYESKGSVRDLYGVSRSFQAQDDLLQRVARIGGYDPSGQIKSGSSIRHKKR
jgi:hypothetical protein